MADLKRRACSVVLGVALGVGVAGPVHATPAEADSLRGQARTAMDRKEYKAAADLLERAYTADPTKHVLLKDLAVVLASDGKIDEAAARYRQYLREVPGDDAAAFAMATTLSWGKVQSQRDESERLLTEYLAKHPDSDEALLQRARVRSWSGRVPEAAADYRAHLKVKPDDETARLELARVLLASPKAEERDEALLVLETYTRSHPEEEKVSLELATGLSAKKDKSALLRAGAIYDAWLNKHPEDSAILLRRARVRAWAGLTQEAAADFRAYGAKNPTDVGWVLELANALSQGPNPGESLPVYEEYIAKHPTVFDARARRARVLLWIGDYGRAEEALTQLLPEASNDAERAVIEVDLARLYAQTGRRYGALDLLDEVLARDAKNAAARTERERVAGLVGSRVEPKFFAYDDKARIRILAATLEGRVALDKQFALITDVGGWSLGTAQETLLAGRANLGAWTRFKFLELEAAAGPRFYEVFDTRFGGRASAKVQPARWASALLAYQYDDIYFDMLQPASVSAGIRGHALHLTGDFTLPYRIRAVGRVGSRALLPDNQSLDATGTIMVPLVRPLSIGYTTQFITWKYNDPSYWSPQEFAAHLGVLRAAQAFPRSGFGYDVQAVLGVAGERILGVPEAGFGPSFGGSGALLYSPTPRVELRLGAQYSQTVREVPVPVTGGSVGAGVAPPPTKEPSKYYWIVGTASAMIYF